MPFDGALTRAACMVPVLRNGVKFTPIPPSVCSGQERGQVGQLQRAEQICALIFVLAILYRPVSKRSIAK